MGHLLLALVELGEAVGSPVSQRHGPLLLQAVAAYQVS